MGPTLRDLRFRWILSRFVLRLTVNLGPVEVTFGRSDWNTEGYYAKQPIVGQALELSKGRDQDETKTQSRD